MVWFHLLVPVLFLQSVLSASIHTRRQQHGCSKPDISALGLDPATTIVLPDDTTAFANETARYTTYRAPTFCAAVKPATTQDVQKIMKYAKQKRIPFLATGGTHGFATTLSELKNGIQLDLGHFKSINVDKNAKTVTIGGSVIFGELIPEVYKEGFQVPTGSQHCVGAVGATLGGGVGRLNGLYGMIADTLQSVKLITAAGDMLTVSETSHSDLFWGLRGAGMNYGVIIEATYKVFDQTPGGIMNADFLFPVNNTRAVFEYFKMMNDQGLSAELSLILQVGYNIQYGGTYVVVNAAYMGPESSGRPLIQGLIDANPTLQNITQTTWGNQLNTAFFGTTRIDDHCAKGEDHSVYGVGIRSYDIPTFEAFFKDMSSLFIATPSAQGSTFFIEAFPLQAVKAIPDNATAFPWRDHSAHLLFNYQLTNASATDTVNAFARTARESFAKNSGFGELQTVVNYGHGDEGPVPLYAQRKLGRLRKLKNKYDPEGVFNFNQPLGS